jgi:hypothetical protein
MARALAVLGVIMMIPGFSISQVITESFGSGVNQFNIEFVEVKYANNSSYINSSPNPVGTVAYNYNMGKYEISRDIIQKANSAGTLGITLQDMSAYGGNALSRPATGVSWLEAAKFVNYLNTSKGYQAAYSITGNTLQLWDVSSSTGSNRFRNINTHYFLPSIDEWFKAAFYNPSNNSYSNYATGSNSLPTSITGGIISSSAVYNLSESSGPADVNSCGGYSFFGTMGQSGNACEILETANDGVNDVANENRMKRGGSWYFNNFLASNVTGEFFTAPNAEWADQGFRVASVPEPSALSLLAIGLGALAMMRRRPS